MPGNISVNPYPTHNGVMIRVLLLVNQADSYVIVNKNEFEYIDMELFFQCDHIFYYLSLVYLVH